MFLSRIPFLCLQPSSFGCTQTLRHSMSLPQPTTMHKTTQTTMGAKVLCQMLQIKFPQWDTSDPTLERALLTLGNDNQPFGTPVAGGLCVRSHPCYHRSRPGRSHRQTSINERSVLGDIAWATNVSPPPCLVAAESQWNSYCLHGGGCDGSSTAFLHMKRWPKG